MSLDVPQGVQQWEGVAMEGKALLVMAARDYETMGP